MNRVKDQTEVADASKGTSHPKESPVIIGSTIVFFKTLGSIVMETVKHPKTTTVINRKTGTVQTGQPPRSDQDSSGRA